MTVDHLPPTAPILDPARWWRRLCWITDRIAVCGDLPESDIAAQAQLEQWIAEGVTVIIDVRSEHSDERRVAEWAPHITYIHLGTHDNGGDQDDRWFILGVEAVLAALAVDPEAKVVIHCHMGVNRAPSLAFAALLATGHFLTLTFAFPFAGLGRAELALHALRHLPPAFRQRANGLLLRAARVAPFSERLCRITHGAISLGQRCRHIAGQFAELLHQFTKRAAQCALRARIAGGFFARLGCLRALLLLRAPLITAGIFLFTAAAMRAVQHLGFSTHHILQSAHLLLATLALLPLAILCPAGAAFLQGLQHFLKLGHFAFGVFLAAIARGVFQAAGAAFQFAAIKHALLRVVGQRFIVFALHAFSERFQMLADRFAQFLNAALQFGALFGAAFGSVAAGFFQSLTQGLTRLVQGARGAIRAAFLQSHRHIP